MPDVGYYLVLNVDGENVTLTGNTYSLSMGTDRAVYAMFEGSGPANVGITIISPINMSYLTSTISVQISASGGTIDKIWWNCKNGSSWIYGSNQTYTITTSMTNFANGTVYAFYEIGRAHV